MIDTINNGSLLKTFVGKVIAGLIVLYVGGSFAFFVNTSMVMAVYTAEQPARTQALKEITKSLIDTRLLFAKEQSKLMHVEQDVKENTTGIKTNTKDINIIKSKCCDE